MATGIDIYDKLVDVVTGKKIEFPKVAKQPYVGNVLLPKKAGEITDMISKDQIMLQDGLIAVELFTKIGEKHQLQRKSSETSGYAFIKGESIEYVERNMQRIFNAFFDNFFSMVFSFAITLQHTIFLIQATILLILQIRKRSLPIMLFFKFLNHLLFFLPRLFLFKNFPTDN